MSLLETAIGWLAPPTCAGCGLEGTSICLACQESEIIAYGERCFDCGRLSSRCQTCDRCRRSGAPRFVWVSTDYEAVAKRLIQNYKFNHQRIAHVSIAEIMLASFYQSNSDQQLKTKDYLLVAIPTASSRIRQRGFDQTRLLARAIAAKLNLPASSALKRQGQSQQLGSKRKLRYEQAKASYYVDNPAKVKGRNILLIDDVVTTGATLAAASRVLRKAGAKSVDALVFAKRL